MGVDKQDLDRNPGGGVRQWLAPMAALEPFLKKLDSVDPKTKACVFFGR